MGWQDADRVDRASRVGRPQVNLGEALALAKAVVAVGAAVVYGVVWVGYEEFYRGLDLTPETVGIGQATIVARAAVPLGIFAVTIASCVASGIVTYRLSRPVLAKRPDSEAWLTYWAQVIAANLLALAVAVVLPVGLLEMVANGPSRSIVVPLVITIGGLAFEVSLIVNDPDVALTDRVRRARRSLYPGRRPRVGAPLMFSLTGVVLAAWAWNFLGDAAYAGQALMSTGVLPTTKVHYLNVGAAPARVHPKAADVLAVCQGEAKALLLRRRDDVAFVLLVRGQVPHVRTEVVRLRDADYDVVSAGDAAQACNPKDP